MADFAEASVKSTTNSTSFTREMVCKYLTEHRKQLLGVILRFESNIESAEDILSIVTVEALSGIESFDGVASVGAYLSRIAQRRAVDHVRTNVGRKSGAQVFYAHELGLAADNDGDGDTLVESAQEALVDSATPERQAEYRQLLDVVESHLPTLESKYPAAFRTWKLHRIDGLDYKEIEELTGTKASTAFLHVFRISEALTTLMGAGKPPGTARRS